MLTAAYFMVYSDNYGHAALQILQPDKLAGFLEGADCLFTCRLKVGTDCTRIPRFPAKNRGEKKKREKDAVVWSDSRRISCLQGVPSNRGTKGNALREERGLAYCNTL